MNITERTVIDSDPESVWKIGGDVANVAAWVPAIETSSLNGDLRQAVFADGGGEVYERIVERDDTARFYVYEYMSGPLALTFYRSRFSVNEHSDGAEVEWSAEFRAGSAAEEADLAEALSAIYRAGLKQLASRWESGL